VETVQDTYKGKGKENDVGSGSDEGTDSASGLSDDRSSLRPTPYGKLTKVSQQQKSSEKTNSAETSRTRVEPETEKRAW